MNIDRKVVEQALEALLAVKNLGWDEDSRNGRELIEALRAALEAEQPAVEPVACAIKRDGSCKCRRADFTYACVLHAAPQPAEEPDDLTIVYMSGLRDGKRAAMAAQQSEKPAAWQNPLHLDQLSDKEVPNWRPLDATNTSKQEIDQRFLDLLCLIHGDGGHYITKHGLDKAAADAVDRLGEIFLKARSVNQAADHIVDVNKMVRPAKQDDDIQPDGHFLDDVYGGNTGEVYVYDTNFSKGEGFYKKIPIVPLTDAEIVTVAKTIFEFDLVPGGSFMRFARAIERAHGITN